MCLFCGAIVVGSTSDDSKDPLILPEFVQTVNTKLPITAIAVTNGKLFLLITVFYSFHKTPVILS